MASIHPAAGNENRGNTASNDEAGFTINSIELEKLFHIKQLDERNRIMKRILLNDSEANIKFLWPLLYGIASIVGPVASTIVYTLIPCHNVISFPEYWYELPLQGAFSLGPIWCCYIIYLCSSYMNIRYIRTMQNFWRMWFITGATTFFSVLISYLIWVYALHYRYPVPLTGYLIILSGLMISSLVTLWNMFPQKWRKNEEFRQRLIRFNYVFLFQQFTTVEYGIITSVLLAVPINYQWIVAIFMPFVREMNVWIITKLVSKATNGDLPGVRLVLIQTNSTGHALMLAITIGSIATTTSAAVIIAEDFVINLLICLKIVYIKMYKNEDPETMAELVRNIHELVIGEVVNFVVPSCYLLCFLIAYYGPNADIIGDIKNGYWQYSAVGDVVRSISRLCAFWLIDASSLFICMIILWKFCKLNLFKVYAALQIEFGKGFCIATMASVNGVEKF